MSGPGLSCGAARAEGPADGAAPFAVRDLNPFIIETWHDVLGPSCGTRDEAPNGVLDRG